MTGQKSSHLIFSSFLARTLKGEAAKNQPPFRDGIKLIFSGCDKFWVFRPDYKIIGRYFQAYPYKIFFSMGCTTDNQFEHKIPGLISFLYLCKPLADNQEVINMINIRLPDNSIKKVPAGSTPLDIAKGISEGLA
ncbi:MAG: hypothetical protein R6U19_02665, partial [Bacteroidales bacterium]